MARWEPNARERLEQAAMALFLERGYDATTVAEIAQRAGLTERTFFRHYQDKRELLFQGGEALGQMFVHALEAADAELPPIDAIAAAMLTAAPFFQGRHAQARLRGSIIASSPELQERERMKLASLAELLAATLQRRGVGASAAKIAGETGIAVFRIAFDEWLSHEHDQGYAETLGRLFDELHGVMNPTVQKNGATVEEGKK